MPLSQTGTSFYEFNNGDVIGGDYACFGNSPKLEISSLSWSYWSSLWFIESLFCSISSWIEGTFSDTVESRFKVGLDIEFSKPLSLWFWLWPLLMLYSSDIFALWTMLGTSIDCYFGRTAIPFTDLLTISSFTISLPISSAGSLSFDSLSMFIFKS